MLKNGQWDNSQCVIVIPPEVCDGKDNDGDGKVDEDLTRHCSSACGTGMETCDNGKWLNCTAPQPKPEVCDGKDNDCDGVVDEGVVMSIYYKDSDGDGYGNPSISVQDCSPPNGFTTDNTDCDDTDKNIHPKAPEISCNGKDDDCRGGDDKIGCAVTPPPGQVTPPQGQGSCSEDDSGELDIKGAKGTVGRRTKIMVRVQNTSKKVYNLGFNIIYDSKILDYIVYIRGSLVKSFDMFDISLIEPGKLKVGGFSTAGKGISKGANGDLIQLKFQVRGGEEDECYPLTIENGLDDIIGLSISGGCFCFGCNGDINGDGGISHRC